MQPRIDGDALRRAAEQLEATFADLASLTDFSFPNVTGDLRNFPRPSPEDEVVAQGFEVLREDTVRAVAVLRAVARALDAQLPISPNLLTFVQHRYIAPFQQTQE